MLMAFLYHQILELNSLKKEQSTLLLSTFKINQELLISNPRRNMFITPFRFPQVGMLLIKIFGHLIKTSLAQSCSELLNKIISIKVRLE